MVDLGAAQVGERIEAGAEIRFHQPGPLPLAGGGHHPAEAGAVQLGLAEIGRLQPGAGQVGFLPEGPPCP